MVYIYAMEYYSDIKKEWNLAIWNNMHGFSGYYTKWSKSDRDIPYDSTFHMWNKQRHKQNKTETAP